MKCKSEVEMRGIINITTQLHYEIPKKSTDVEKHCKPNS